MKRASLLLALAVAAVLLVSSVGTVHSQARPYEGVEIRLGVLARAISDGLKPLIPEFERETGARVVLEQQSFGALFDKMMLEFVAGTGYYDIVYLSPGFMGGLIEEGYLLPLNDLIERHNVDFSDFLEASLAINRYEDDTLWAFPYLADTTVFLYRTDLFEDPAERAAFRQRYGYDLAPPRTTREWLDIAEFFTRDTTGDGRINFYGFGYPQIAVAYSNLWALWVLWTFGAEYYDSEYNATLFDPRAIEAFRWAQRLHKFQPPGALAWDYGEHFSRFCDGGLAMTAGWFHMGLEANDPQRCGIAGKAGYATVPAGPGGRVTGPRAVLGGGGLAITKDSRNPDAAFAFLNWVFGNRDRALRWFFEGGAIVRESIWNAPEVAERYPWATDFFPIATESLSTIARQRPALPEAPQIFEFVSEAWHNVALGRRTPEQALREANDQIHRLLAPRRR